SSTVCGTIVRAVCSRSHGQSLRSRWVSSWSSSSAWLNDTLARLAGGAGLRGRRLVAGLVLRLLAEVLLGVVPPLVEGVLLLLLLERLLDRRLHLVEGDFALLLRRVDRAERLDHVPAEARVHRLRDLVRLQREGGLLERGYRLQLAGNRPLLADGEPAAARLARVDRVLERQLREVGAVLQLAVDRQRFRVAHDEDLAQVAAPLPSGLVVLRRLLVV